MKVERTSAVDFTAEFESENELREEYRVNLSHSALRLPTTEAVPLHTTLLVTLRGPRGGEVYVRATAVAALPDGIALAIETHTDDMLQRLLLGEPRIQPSVADQSPVDDLPKSAWDRVRGLSQMEKLLLAVKAEHSDRALLLQDSDPRVLMSLLRNPRLTVDEVVRVAKSSFLNYQIAEVILKTTQWMSSLDIRLALIHNPKTPPAFALRILPTLPEVEIRAIARAGTHMALKQAAIRRLQGK